MLATLEKETGARLQLYMTKYHGNVFYTLQPSEEEHNSFKSEIGNKPFLSSSKLFVKAGLVVEARGIKHPFNWENGKCISTR